MGDYIIAGYCPALVCDVILPPGAYAINGVAETIRETTFRKLVWALHAEVDREFVNVLAELIRDPPQPGLPWCRGEITIVMVQHWESLQLSEQHAVFESMKATQTQKPRRSEDQRGR